MFCQRERKCSLFDRVGFVVNRRLYEQYGKERILPKYVRILEQLLGYGKEVYLLCHANDDLDICEELKQKFEDKDSIHVINKVLSCFEFQKLARNFDYVVAARYHSIVHSYKECIPCVALGWAVKYQELLELMDQKSYLINIGEDTLEDISHIVSKMEATHVLESEKIKQQLEIVQQQNCFDEMESVIECQK